MKKKIIQYNPRFIPSIGGGETYVNNLVQNIHEYYFEVVTNSLHGLPTEESYSQNILVKRFLPYDQNLNSSGSPFIRKISFPLRLFSDTQRLKKKNEYLIKSNANLVHFHGIGFCNNLLKVDSLIKHIFFSKLINFNEINIPKILTVHNLFSPLNSNPALEAYEKFIIDQFDTIICVDKNIERYVSNYSQLTNKYKKIYFIPNSVDLNRFTFSRHQPKEKLHIGFVGRFEYSRGIHLLQLLIDFLPNFCELHIASNQIEGVNKPNVYFHGSLSETSVPDFISNVDLIFNPVLAEGISRITLESMACGRPVIMLDKGDRYPIINGKTGFLVKEDIHEILSLLENIYESKGDTIINLGCNARKIIEEEFSNDIIIPKIITIYDQLTN